MYKGLQPLTIPGRRLVTLAETLAEDFAGRAQVHDREGSFAMENIEALKVAGYFGAPIPAACGGMGVESAHDVLLASSRLARGDASTTIGVNMHLNAAMTVVRSWRRALVNGDAAGAAVAQRGMEAIAAGQMIIATIATEPGRELPEPATRAVRTETGWSVTGTKIFGTMSPAATHFAITLTYEDAVGEERMTFAQVRADAPGVTLNDDWDALGMRASGSGSVTFQDVQIPDGVFRGNFPIGEWSIPLLERFLIPGLTHAAPSLGIAEAAAMYATDLVSATRKGRSKQLLAERAPIQHLAAENAIDLMAMRAAFSQAGRAIDDYFDAHVDAAHEDVVQVFNEVQCAKTFLNAAGIRVVDRSLTMSGGAGYMNKHPLSRLYRDVRAGPFMHPLAATAAVEFIGRVSLGLSPNAA